MAELYDGLVDAYDECRNKDNDFWLVERETVRNILSTMIQGKHVLELACGTGFYTYDLIDWGAKFVTAVDASAQMLQALQRSHKYETYKERVRIVQANCCSGMRLPEAPFDFVFAAYLLVHAATRDELVSMFRTIHDNMRQGGTFMTVTCYPCEDPKRYWEQEAECMKSNGLKPIRIMEQDYGDRVSYQVRLKRQYFVDYQFRLSVIQSAARDAGFMNGIRVIDCKEMDISLPVEASSAVRKQMEFPDFGILVAEK